jgi:hypothetical protein
MLFSACSTPTSWGSNLVNAGSTGTVYAPATAYPGNYLEGTTATTQCAAGCSVNTGSLPYPLQVVYTCQGTSWLNVGEGCTSMLMAHMNRQQQCYSDLLCGNRGRVADRHLFRIHVGHMADGNSRSRLCGHNFRMHVCVFTSCGL